MGRGECEKLRHENTLEAYHAKEKEEHNRKIEKRVDVKMEE